MHKMTWSLLASVKIPPQHKLQWPTYQYIYSPNCGCLYRHLGGRDLPSKLTFQSLGNMYKTYGVGNPSQIKLPLEPVRYPSFLEKTPKTKVLDSTIPVLICIFAAPYLTKCMGKLLIDSSIWSMRGCCKCLPSTQLCVIVCLLIPMLQNACK